MHCGKSQIISNQKLKQCVYSVSKYTFISNENDEIQFVSTVVMQGMYNVKKNKGFWENRKHIKVSFDRYDKNPPFETIMTCPIPIGFYTLVKETA